MTMEGTVSPTMMEGIVSMTMMEGIVSPTMMEGIVSMTMMEGIVSMTMFDGNVGSIHFPALTPQSNGVSLAEVLHCQQTHCAGRRALHLGAPHDLDAGASGNLPPPPSNMRTHSHARAQHQPQACLIA